MFLIAYPYAVGVGRKIHTRNILSLDTGSETLSPDSEANFNRLEGVEVLEGAGALSRLAGSLAGSHLPSISNNVYYQQTPETCPLCSTVMVWNIFL